MGAFIDITGNRYGRLTVIKRAKSNSSYHGAMWECKCDCGKTIVANGQNLKSGNTTSCGCYHKETFTAKKHGKTGTRLYRIWKAMHTRCNNQKSPAYKYYGDRGIRLCEEWSKDFQAFAAWALANGYRDDLTIDRIDTNENYEPSNCRWVTMAEQNQNKRAKNGYKIEEK